MYHVKHEVQNQPSISFAAVYGIRLICEVVVQRYPHEVVTHPDRVTIVSVFYLFILFQSDLRVCSVCRHALNQWPQLCQEAFSFDFSPVFFSLWVFHGHSQVSFKCHTATERRLNVNTWILGKLWKLIYTLCFNVKPSISSIFTDTIILLMLSVQAMHSPRWELHGIQKSRVQWPQLLMDEQRDLDSHKPFYQCNSHL